MGTKIKKPVAKATGFFVLAPSFDTASGLLRTIGGEGLESHSLQGKAGSRNVTELPPWALNKKKPVAHATGFSS